MLAAEHVGTMCQMGTAKVGAWGHEFCIAFGTRLLREFGVRKRAGARFLCFEHSFSTGNLLLGPKEKNGDRRSRRHFPRSWIIG